METIFSKLLGLKRGAPRCPDIPMPPVKTPRAEEDSRWDELTKVWTVGSEFEYLGRKLRVVEVQLYYPGCYPCGSPLSIPPVHAGFLTEYCDNNGVIREYFMPARVALSILKP